MIEDSTKVGAASADRRIRRHVYMASFIEKKFESLEGSVLA